MAGTYSQIYIHVVFAVQGRQNLIPPDHKNEIYKYIGGIFRNNKQKLLAINGMSDHLHILFNLKPEMAVADLIRDVKAHSSKFINQKQWMRGKFNWQSGYGAFSYSISQLGNVISYIENQERHHRKHTFREEYEKMLQLFNVPFDGKYLFEWIE